MHNGMCVEFCFKGVGGITTLHLPQVTDILDNRQGMNMLRQQKHDI